MIPNNISPDPEEGRWIMKTILKHITKEQKEGHSKIYCKKKYKDGHTVYHTLDSIRIQDPFLASLYEIKKGLRVKP